MLTASDSSAGRRMNLTKDSSRDQNSKGGHEPMDQERIEKRACAVCYPAKNKASEDCRKRFDLRLAQVHQREGNCLKPKCFWTESACVSEKHPAAKKELPTEQIDKGIPGEPADLFFI